MASSWWCFLWRIYSQQWHYVAYCGMNWHVAFFSQTGLEFPVWVKVRDNTCKTISLSRPPRSFPTCSTLRIIVQFLQGFSSEPMVPHFSKFPSTSLRQDIYQLPNMLVFQKIYDVHIHNLRIDSTQTVLCLCNTATQSFMPIHHVLLYHRCLDSVPLPTAPH